MPESNERTKSIAAVTLATLLTGSACPIPDLEEITNDLAAYGLRTLQGRPPSLTPTELTFENSLQRDVLPYIYLAKDNTSGNQTPATYIQLLRRNPTATLSITREDALQYVGDYLARSSAVVPHDGDEVTTGINIEVVGDYQGVLEDCGCQSAKSAGGLVRLDAHWGSSGGTKTSRMESDDIGSSSRPIRLCYGEMLGAITDEGFLPGSEALIISTLYQHVDVFVPGTRELMMYAFREDIRDEICAQPAVAVNVYHKESRARVFSAHRDIRLDSGQVVRVVGVTRIDPKELSLRMRERVAEELMVTDGIEELNVVLHETPNDVAVVILGKVHPADLTRVAPRPQMLIFCGDLHVPRVLNGKRERTQCDGRVHDSPVLFGGLGNYGYCHVVWDAKNGVYERRDVVLKSPPPKDGPLPSKVRMLLEGMSHDSVELSFFEPLLADSRSYVGSVTCQRCHASEFAQWSQTPHARAMSSLRDSQRHRAPNCVACHVVGFGQRSGYHSKKPHLEDVGCEVCHGPGSAHVNEPGVAMRRVPTVELCATCHTPKHSELLADPTAYMGRVTHAHSSELAR